MECEKLRFSASVELSTDFWFRSMCRVHLCETLIWNRITRGKRQGMRHHFAVMNNGKSGMVLEPSDASGGSFGEPVVGWNFRSSLKDLFCQPFWFLFSYLYPFLLKLARVDSGFQPALTNFRRWMTWRHKVSWLSWGKVLKGIVSLGEELPMYCSFLKKARVLSMLTFQVMTRSFQSL